MATPTRIAVLPSLREPHHLEVDTVLGGYRCSCGRWRYIHISPDDPDGVARRMHESHCEDPDAG